MMEYSDKVNLAGFTLVVPAVSVGNVGQLTVDLLINTLNMKELCRIWHPCVVPVAGGDPFGRSKNISTGCEVFYCEKLQLLAMQVRSGILRTRNDFLQFLCNWAKRENMKQIVILTGSSAHERRDDQLVGSTLRYIFCPLTIETARAGAIERNWKEYENIEKQHSKSERNGEISHIPGSGISLKLFRTCVKENIPCSILIEFCSDGNNVPDAFRLADYLDELLKVKENKNIPQWTPPPSWILMFGPLPPAEIFN